MELPLRVACGDPPPLTRGGYGDACPYTLSVTATPCHLSQRERREAPRRGGCQPPGRLGEWAVGVGVVGAATCRPESLRQSLRAVETARPYGL